MGIKIIKVGGLILHDQALRKNVEEYVVKCAKNDKIILVVSAMGRDNDPYSTDGLNNSIRGYLTLKERNRLKAIGETYSVLDVVARLRLRGLKAISFSYIELGITDLKKGRYRTDTKRLVRALKEDEIAVVPGYLASDKDHEPTTLKREGSDLTAVLLANSLKLQDVYLVKDIKGVYDTNKVLHHNLSYHNFFSIIENFTSPLSIEAARLAQATKLRLHIINTDGYEVCQIK